MRLMVMVSGATSVGRDGLADQGVDQSGFAALEIAGDHDGERARQMVLDGTLRGRGSPTSRFSTAARDALALQRGGEIF